MLVWHVYYFVGACCTGFGVSTTQHVFFTTWRILLLLYNFADFFCTGFQSRSKAFLQLCRFLLYWIWLFYNFADSFFYTGFCFSTMLQILAVLELAFLQFCRFLLYQIWLFYNFADACLTDLAFLQLCMAFLQLCRFFGFFTILQTFAVPDILPFYNFADSFAFLQFF